MSNSILRVGAGVMGLALVALPQGASAQPYEEGPPPHRPYLHDDFRPAKDDGGYARVADMPREDRHAAYDEEDDQPRPHGRYRPDAGFEGPEVYGGPGRWGRWGRPAGPYWGNRYRREGYRFGGYRLEGYRADGYRPVVVTARPIYAPPVPSHRDSADVGCTVQTTEHETESGGLETVTRRSCYTR